MKLVINNIEAKIENYEIKAVFKNKPNSDHHLEEKVIDSHVIGLEFYEDITALIQMSVGGESFNLQLVEGDYIQEAHGYLLECNSSKAKCVELIIKTIGKLETKGKPELPPNLSVVAGSPFYGYMISHNMTAGECYQNWITDYMWTDELLVANGYMTENILVPTDGYEDVKLYKSVGWTDERLVEQEMASWQPVEKPAYEEAVSADKWAETHNAKSIEDWADSHSYFTAALPDSFKELFNDCKPMEFTNTKLGQTWEEQPSIEFTDIQDNLDFMELVDKFHAEYRLKGGQKNDGTWFLSGTKV
jgi:hypothetical protein